MAEILKITSENFEDKVLKSEKPVADTLSFSVPLPSG